MAAKPIDSDVAERVIADWRTGEYSQRQLSDKYSISTGSANNLCKGVARKSLGSLKRTGSVKGVSYVYIITSDEFKQDGIYKIGITNNIERRLADMQTGCPFILYALRVFGTKNPLAVEVMLHSFFDKKRLRGEWFKLDDLDIAYIDAANFTVIDGISHE